MLARHNYFFYFLSGILMVWSCEPKKAANETTSASASETEEASDDETMTTEEGQQPGTLAFEPLSDAELIGTIGNALVSAAESEDDAGASLNPGLAITTLATVDTCKASGSPNVDENSALSSAQIAGLSAYCDLSKHPDGPDTTLGGIDRIKGILCGLGNVEYDGTAREIAMKVTTECFSQTFVDMVSEQFCQDPGACPNNTAVIQHIVTAQKITGAATDGSAFDRSITLTPPAGKEGFAYNIKLVQTETLLAAAVYESTSNAENGGTFAVSLSTGSPAMIRYEGRFNKIEDQQANDGWFRHIRVLAKGTFDQASKVFTGLESMQYVFWDTYLNGGSNFKSVVGSPSAGFKAIGVGGGSAPFDIATYDIATDTTPANKTLCYGTGECTDNAGLSVKAAEDLAFAKSMIMDDDLFVDYDTWFNSHGPLQFTAVTLAAEQD